MTKFSVLLPTRNRLEYLKFAINSVLQQDYENWEIVVSDNCSDQDIEGYITSLADQRIKYYRTETFIPVTDNWNMALEKSDGDYVIMLGDDDALMQGYFRTLLNLLKDFDSPDLVYSSALLYAYPGVVPGFPQGLLHKWGNAEFLEGKTRPFLLDKAQAVDTVQRSLQFKVLFNFNMQFALVSRCLIQECQKQGSFYQSPFPDYYAMTVLMLKAKKILAVPDPLVVVGITSKSFGYYFFNEKEQVGVEFLKNYPNESLIKNIKQYLMPGLHMNTSWLIALEAVKRNFGQEFNLEVNYKKYRILQMLHYFKNYACEKNMSLRDIWNMKKFLFWWEKLFYFFPCLICSQVLRWYPKKQQRDDYIYNFVTSFSHPSFTMERIQKDYNDISEIIRNHS
ncbi:MAG: glycosyltransferase [Chlamydiales bacterium]|nr:glycosyltransferase [Chlamydiales bacterium]